MRVPFIAAWAKPSASSETQKAFPINPGLVHDEFASIHDIVPAMRRELDEDGTQYPVSKDGKRPLKVE